MPTRYAIHWTTGDTDRRLTATEVRELAAEAGGAWVGPSVVDAAGAVLGRVRLSDGE